MARPINWIRGDQITKMFRFVRKILKWSPGFKTCIDCKLEKPIEDFWMSRHLRQERKTNLQRIPEINRERMSQCKLCAKARIVKYREENPAEHRRRAREWSKRNPEKTKVMRLNKYGMTVNDHDQMLKRQNGVCAICEGQFTKGKCQPVDHCHKTGKVRGLLCDRCNPGLGHFLDNPALLRKAADYLERNS